VDNAWVALDEFILRDIASPEHLDTVWMAADFPERLEEERYLYTSST
jgi:hypothetical protein